RAGSRPRRWSRTPSWPSRRDTTRAARPGGRRSRTRADRYQKRDVSSHDALHRPVRGPMNLRSAVPADAPALARLHLETLPGKSDLSPLGERLIRHFYARAIERGAAQVRLAEEDGEVLSFIVVTDDIGTMFQRALLAGPGDLLTFLWKSNPIGLARAFVAQLTSCAGTVASAPEMVSLGVAHKARGRRLGRIMMCEGQKVLDDAGFRNYQTNVHVENEHVLPIVYACGFEVVQRYRKSGHEIVRLVCRVSPPPPP